MEKIQKIIPFASFCLYFGKVLILPSTFVDVAILLVLATFTAYFEFRADVKQNEFEKRIADLEVKFQEKTKDIDSLKGSITNLSIGRSIGMLNGR